MGPGINISSVLGYKRLSLLSADTHQPGRSWCIAGSRGVGRDPAGMSLRDHTSLECPLPPFGAVRGLQVARRNALSTCFSSDRSATRRLRSTFSPASSASPDRVQVTPRGNAVFSARHLRLRHQHFDLTQQHDDLLCLEPLLRHRQSSFSHKAWSKNGRPGRSCPRVESTSSAPQNARHL
jgi:hypothetical protein